MSKIIKLNYYLVYQLSRSLLEMVDFERRVIPTFGLEEILLEQSTRNIVNAIINTGQFNKHESLVNAIINTDQFNKHESIGYIHVHMYMCVRCIYNV